MYAYNEINLIDIGHCYQTIITVSTYFILGNKSDTMPLNNFKSSDKNFGTFTSRIARKHIRSCIYEKIINGNSNSCN